ncbi:MAG: HEAT repeat domain-containing protein [Lentisphaerae bacterium]|nr:HEAT repeat domain-containing protein [Lentisphaerota bacterium]MBT5606756.1 HEAT repeat domain-containing protein [Lentisphaerota bacterium]MBT7061552.1 HEAT repeat domain-containing protein [Lentisphaerota bacterium]MBT7843897.1 HEAT repeat domain-containing protein [Lentisphaerota bacterium]
MSIALTVFAAATASAQPTRPRDTIPSDATETVRRHVESLYSTDVNVRCDAAFALGKLGDEALPALPFLAELLVDDELRWWHFKGDTPGEEAARALLAMGRVSTPCLVDALQYPKARKWTVFALRRMQDPAAAEGLLALLDREEAPDILIAAVGALGEIGFGQATPRLVQMIREASTVTLRAAAVRALGGTGGDGAAPVLICLVEADPSADVRCAAALALGQTGGPHAVKVLVRVASGDTVTVRREAVRALGTLKATEAVDALLELLDLPDLQEYAAWALGEIGDVRAAAGLLRTAETAPRVGTRSGAVDSLGRLGATSVIDGVLGVAERDPSPFVRRRAVMVLCACSPPVAAEPLIRLLGEESDVTVRGALARALGREGSTRARQILEELITSDEHWYVRKAAVDALAEIPGEHGVLRLAAGDTHPAVRLAVEKASESRHH